jgi:hypothetical protein
LIGYQIQSSFSAAGSIFNTWRGHRDHDLDELVRPATVRTPARRGL